MPKRFNHKKVRGIGLHSLTKERGLYDSKGAFTGYARIVDTANIDRKEFDHALMETLRMCPIKREVVTFIPAEYTFKGEVKVSDVQLDHVITSDFQLMRETIGVQRNKMPDKFRTAIERGNISEHLVDLPGFRGDEKELATAITKRTGMQPGEPHWDYEVIEEIARRRQKKLMDALKKHTQ